MRKVLPLGLVFFSLVVSAEPAGRSFEIRTFVGLTSPPGASGDCETAAERTVAACWLPTGAALGDPDGVVTIVRLTREGERRSYSFASGTSLPATRSIARLDAARGTVLLARSGAGWTRLHRLDPATLSVSAWAIPWEVTSLGVSQVDSRVWLAGAGRVAELVRTSEGDALEVFPIPAGADGSSRPDREGLLLLPSVSGLVTFSTSTRRYATWVGTGTFSIPTIGPGNVLWGTDPGRSALVRLDRATRVLTSFDTPAVSGGWTALSVDEERVNLVSRQTAQLLSLTSAGFQSGSSSGSLLPPLESAPVSPERFPLVAGAGSAAQATDALRIVDRVACAEDVAGRGLFSRRPATGSTILWSGPGALLLGGSLVELWTASSQDFESEAVLPVVVSIRPTDPSTNYRTEVVVHNVDAASAVLLELRTSAGHYSTTIDVPAGGTLVFPDVIGSFVDRQTGVPTGTDVSGTLTARFRNGSGRLAARVFTEFGSGGVYPSGSTTGAAFDSVDPTAELFVTARALNGLRSSDSLRTNVGLANLCGAAGECPALDLLVEFRDDSSGRVVSRQAVTVPARQWVQLLSPVSASSADDRGSFSMLVSASGGSGGAAFDAYATVLDGSAHDATFLRATPAPASSAVVLPVAVDAPGIGTRFVTEVSLTASPDAPATADVTFRSSRTGLGVSETLKLEPGQGVLWANAVDHFRLLAPQSVAPDDSGPVSVSFRSPQAGLVSARTLSLRGTGLAFDAVDPAFEEAVTRKRVTGLAENERFRTNLVVSNLGVGPEGQPVDVLVSLFAPDGSPAGPPLKATVAPGETLQWSRLLAIVGLRGEGFTATIERTAGRDAFDSFATVIDNVTDDPSFLRAR